ncbi:hypothetical protein GA0070616_4588 [Micromonospora nigra]|uniref:Uncharacterized protein n=1 Tax=Micromonospora nigra TaxID=145857 RepID=A0A1C6SUU9_9ACTN|nr:hypothetical protein [Micromonospora nigra]SCL32915.1 hypothetical protein GA0070616_4588 [Micromonospora nigra]
MSAYRCAVLVALNEDDAQHWRGYVAADRVVLTVEQGPRLVEGLRVTVVFVTPDAQRGERFCEVRAALRRNLAMMRGASRAFHYLSAEPR